jgi:hypothetical protein
MPEGDLLEEKLKEHILQQFDEICETSYLLRKFNIDVRFHMVIDNIVAKRENPDNNLPDVMLQIGLGEKEVD